MKRCPQCGAEYDDYVQYCFVDGAELVVGSVFSKSAPVHVSTPVPAPISPPPSGMGIGASPGQPSPGARPPRSRPSPPPPEPRTSPLWAFLVLLLLGAALLGFGAVVVALLFFSTGPSETTAGKAPTVPVPPIDLPAPLPPPVPTQIARVPFDSEPQGAQLWEQNKFLCTTPCVVEHPEYAPLPREFVLRLEGYIDTSHRMTDTTSQRVQLQHDAPKPVPLRPRPAGGDDILDKR